MQMLRDLGLPLIYFGLLYWSISGHEQSMFHYREQLSSAALLVSGVLLSLHWLRGRTIRPLGSRMAVFWMGFFVLGLSSAAFGGNWIGSLYQLKLYFSVVLLGLSFFSWMEQPSAERLMPGICIAVCLAHVLILNVVVAHASGLIVSLPELGSSVPYHTNIRHVAYHGMIAASAGLSLFFLGGRLRLAGLVLGAAAIFGLVFLGQRGGLLGLSIYILTAAFLLPSLRVKIVLSGVVIVCVCFAIVFALDRQDVGNRYSGSIVERLDTRGSEAITSTSHRSDIWLSAIKAGLRKPLLGYGPDSYRRVGIDPAFQRYAQPHNALLQLLLEFGVVGVVWVAWFLIPLMRQAVRGLVLTRTNRTATVGPALLFSLLVGFGAFSMVDGVFYHPVPLLAIAVLIPLFFAMQPPESQSG